MTRFAAFIGGLGLLGFVVFLGLQVGKGQIYVVWFGLGSAILAPLGIASIGYALRAGHHKVLEELSKVPEIERLIHEARSQEEKIRLLEEERERLLETVQLHARKESLLRRKEGLENEALRVLRDLDAIEDELRSVSWEIEISPAAEEIERLDKKLRARRRGDIVFRLGERYLTLDRDLILSLPAGGIVWWYIKLLNDFRSRLESRGIKSEAASEEPNGA